MKKRIFTGNYEECKIGNLISISGDRGKSIGFTGKSIPQLAPKRKFWEIWHNNIGKIPEEQNLKYGIYVPDISISEGLEIIEHKKPEYIREILQKLMEKEVER